MITYVNTVFVSDTNVVVESLNGISASDKGKFVLYDIDNNAYDLTANTQRFKIGMITGKTVKKVDYHTGATTNVPIVKWSNIIQTADIKSLSTLEYKADSEDTIAINFTGVQEIGAGKLLSQAGKRIIVRLTFKDLPTRYRKWTESYEYVTKDGDTAVTIATGIANLINKQWKRARVNATAAAGVLTLTAMKYDDDDMVDSLNWAEKVRFNANVYYTDPAGEGWESLNKHFPKGLTITKTPGFRYAASAKLVRDREAQGMGYEGILNRGEGTWPIIKPDMNTKLDGKYNALTLEFENMYRSADDLFRKTKQTVEIYVNGETLTLAAIAGKIKTAMGKNDRVILDEISEDGIADPETVTTPENH